MPAIPTHLSRTKIALGAGLFGLVASFVVAVTGTSGGARADAQSPAPARHFIANLKGATTPFALGYNLADKSSVSSLSLLPAAVQSVFWLGQKCPKPADSTFKATVDALASNPKVFAYYLSDEPHIGDCPGGPAALRSRADYIRAASHGRQKSFVVLSKVTDYKPFAPASSHVDLVGLDPYPCSTAHPQCDLGKIGEKVSAARSAGVPPAAIVPVYQAFGQERTTSHYYNQPTASQEHAMLMEWKRLVPAPVMDYTYGWSNQSSAAPTLVDSPALQKVFATFFATGN
ncbi:hypothetical protein JOF29_003545 [Kribbella aluminosa]|uniref:Uncharacterized protein n=1 Tax=Kribbella aluminosa TaxID=416017 RepID=A0ABS4ULC5_9ACTN|nr:hypothetical protein [Kribbella aluminosa]MBP2352462.1 hypothetical protein [Kribbella aluminosa]